MRVPCDVEKNYQELTTEITEHTEIILDKEEIVGLWA